MGEEFKGGSLGDGALSGVKKKGEVNCLPLHGRGDGTGKHDWGERGSSFE